MSKFRSMMSQLRVSKEKSQKDNGNNDNNKYLYPNKNKTYILRFLPYMNKADTPATIKEFKYHYIDGKKYLCEGFYSGCELCEKKNRATTQRLANIQIIKSDDTKYKAGDYHILPIHWTMYNLIDAYEKDNSCSLFDVYGAGEFTVRVNEQSKTNGSGQKYTFLGYERSSISDTQIALSPEILNYDDEQIISFLKEFTFDLDKEEANIPKFKPIVIEKEIPKVKEIKEELVTPLSKDVTSSIADTINNIDEEIESTIDDIKPIIKSKKVVEKAIEEKVEEIKAETKKEIIEDSSSEDTSNEDTDDYINDFLNSIDD